MSLASYKPLRLFCREIPLTSVFCHIENRLSLNKVGSLKIERQEKKISGLIVCIVNQKTCGLIGLTTTKPSDLTGVHLVTQDRH